VAYLAGWKYAEPVPYGCGAGGDELGCCEEVEE